MPSIPDPFDLDAQLPFDVFQGRDLDVAFLERPLDDAVVHADHLAEPVDVLTFKNPAKFLLSIEKNDQIFIFAIKRLSL